MNSRIKNYSNKIDAEVDRGLLKAHGIPCIVASDDAGGMRPDLMMSTGGVWLLVEEKDINEALRLLKKND
jgi:type III secretory pathway lipoprotein EscJ